VEGSSGDRLVATARDPRRLEELVQKYRDQVRTAPLDVVDEHAAHEAAQLAMKVFALAFALPLAVRRPVIINGAGGSR